MDGCRWKPCKEYKEKDYKELKMTNTKRNYTLDWIRVFAMGGILLDHYLCALGSQSLNDIGMQIGVGGGVTVFFVISAWLFGHKWAGGGYKPFAPGAFLKKRCVRIFIPVWILIAFTIPLEYVFKGRFELQTIMFNIVGLGWVRPFGVSGHLWYITMLMVLYVAFVLASRVRLDKTRLRWWLIGMIAVLAAYFIMQNRLTTYSKCGPPMFLLVGTMVFARGNTIMAIAKQHKIVVSIIALLTLGFSQYLYHLGWNDTHKALAVASAIIAGFFVFWATFANINIKSANRHIEWIAGISYEIYLVHQPLLDVLNVCIANRWLMTAAWLITTLISAILLNKATGALCTRAK